jgi:hypothetical protein
MSGGMVTFELVPPFGIDFTGDLEPHNLFTDLLIQVVQNALAHFLDVHNFIDDSLYFNMPGVVELAPGSRVEGTSLEHHYVRELALSVPHDRQYLRLEPQLMRVVISGVSLRNVVGVVMLTLGHLCDLLLPLRNLVIQVPRDGLVRKLLDYVRGDAPGSHCHYPIVDRHLLIPLYELLYLLLLNRVR